MVGALTLDMEASLTPENIGNIMSYEFLVRYKVMKRPPADWWCDEIGPDEACCQMLIQAAKELKAEGYKTIASGYGFFAIYQKRAAAEVNILVFLSPLLMVPMLSMMMGGRGVRILSAGRGHLKGDFLKTVGTDENVNYAVGGPDGTEEFYHVHVACSKKATNPEKTQAGVTRATKSLIRQYPDIGCFVFKYSDVPPSAEETVRRTGCPVFDFIGLAHMVARAVVPPKYPEFFG